MTLANDETVYTGTGSVSNQTLNADQQAVNTDCGANPPAPSKCQTAQIQLQTERVRTQPSNDQAAAKMSSDRTDLANAASCVRAVGQKGPQGTVQATALSLTDQRKRCVRSGRWVRRRPVGAAAVVGSAAARPPSPAEARGVGRPGPARPRTTAAGLRR